MKNIIEENRESKYFTWKLMKLTIRSRTIQHSTYKKGNDEQTLKLLEKKLLDLESKIATKVQMDTDIEDEHRELIETKSLLEDLEL